MKYKKGDKIVIRKDFKNGSYKLGTCSSMEQYRGKTFTIVETVETVTAPHYLMEEIAWGWSDEMIDHEATEVLNRKEPVYEPF